MRIINEFEAPLHNKCITQKSIIKGFGKVTVLKEADETDAVEANKNKGNAFRR